MKNLVLYGLGGLGAFVLVSAVLKRKPGARMFSSKVLPAPKVYIVAKGDEAANVAARFGVPLMTFIKAGNLYRGKGKPGTNVMGYVPFTPGLAVALPPGVADLGARAKARGVAR